MIDPKLKEAWQWTKQYSEGYTVTLANAYLDAEARARRAEWLNVYYKKILMAHAHCETIDHQRFIEQLRWTDAQWREAVVKELEGESNP